MAAHALRGGWAGITLPKEYGGRGGTGMQQVIFNEEMAQVRRVGRRAHGRARDGRAHADRARHRGSRSSGTSTPILRGEELWCQLYSEPGAGSDLASLGTRAVLDGDEYVVNGQKVWNSFAQFADYGILLGPHRSRRSRSTAASRTSSST